MTKPSACSPCVASTSTPRRISLRRAPTLALAFALALVGLLGLVGGATGCDSGSGSSTDPAKTDAGADAAVDVGGGDDVAVVACAGDADCAAAFPQAGPCQVAICETAAGVCALESAPDDTACEDGDPCTTPDLCAGGVCVAGAALPCDDADACTEDTCDATGSCVHTPITGCSAATCGDGDCKDGETCETCPADCGECPAACGDGGCTGAETELSCHEDCAPEWMAKTAAGFHGRAFIADTASCATCHGADLVSGVRSCETCHSGWKTKCTFCHGGQDDQSGAPPFGLEGESDASARPVGSHTAHVSGSTVKQPYGCVTCHAVPTDALSPGHVDGDGQADVVVSDCDDGGSFDAATGTCSSVYCHGNGKSTSSSGSAAWTDGPKGCDGCHPQGGLGGDHKKHLSKGFGCQTCHGATVGSSTAISDPSKHLNCVKDLQGSFTYDTSTHKCSSIACHGSETW